MDLYKFSIFAAIPFLQPLIQQLLRTTKTCLGSSNSETCQRTSFLVVLAVVCFLSLAINFRFSHRCFGIFMRMDHTLVFSEIGRTSRKRAPRILTSIEKLHSCLLNSTFPRSAYPFTLCSFLLFLISLSRFHVHGNSFEI